MKKIALWMTVVAAVAVMQVQAGDVFIDENFDSRGTGEVRSKRDVGASHFSLGDSECSLEIVDASSSPVDPFGGTDNKSLRLTDFSDVSVGAYAMWSTRKTRMGKVSVDFFVKDHGERCLWISAQNGAKVGPKVRVYKGVFHLYDGDRLIKLDNECAPEMKHSLVLDFDGETGTYSGTLDGTPLSRRDKIEFEFKEDLSSLYLVLVEASGGSTWQSDVYVDNVTLERISE